MNTSLSGFNTLIATFSSSTASKGDVVSMSGNMAVSKAAAKSFFKFDVFICCHEFFSFLKLKHYADCCVFSVNVGNKKRSSAA